MKYIFFRDVSLTLLTFLTLIGVYHYHGIGNGESTMLFSIFLAIMVKSKKND